MVYVAQMSSCSGLPGGVAVVDADDRLPGPDRIGVVRAAVEAGDAAEVELLVAVEVHQEVELVVLRVAVAHMLKCTVKGALPVILPPTLAGRRPEDGDGRLVPASRGSTAVPLTVTAAEQRALWVAVRMSNDAV